MSSVFHKNHKSVDQMSGAELLRETNIQSEIRGWNCSHPSAPSLNDQYQDLIVFEPGLRQLMSRVPMMIRLGGGEEPSLSNRELRSLNAAVVQWQPVRNFYDVVSPRLEAHIRRNNEYFDSTPAERHKSGSLGLIHFSREIDSAARNLAALVASLYEAGFTPGALLSESFSQRYKQSA